MNLSRDIQHNYAQKNLSAEQPPARENARFSVANENRRWPGRSVAPPRHWTQKADRQLREVAAARNNVSRLFPKVSGFSAPAISERFITKARDTRVLYSPLSGWAGPTGLTSVSPHQKHSANPLTATASNDGCAKPSGWNCDH